MERQIGMSTSLICIGHSQPKSRISKQYRNNMNIRLYRRRQVNQIFPNVSKILYMIPGISQRQDLVDLAKEACQLLNLKLDRDASRTTEMCLVWFCENWNQVLQILPQLVEKRRSYISKNSFLIPQTEEKLSKNREESIFDDFDKLSIENNIDDYIFNTYESIDNSYIDQF